MALTKDTKDRLVIALTDAKAGAEVAAAIEAGGNVQAASVAAVTTADAVDLTTAEALANANKVAINAVIAALKAAGLMAP